MNQITKSRMASELAAFDIEVQDCISNQAEQSAKLALDNGWDPNGAQYDLTSMDGDRQELDELLGRPSTHSEQVALERCIRHAIAEHASE